MTRKRCQPHHAKAETKLLIEPSPCCTKNPSTKLQPLVTPCSMVCTKICSVPDCSSATAAAAVRKQSLGRSDIRQWPRQYITTSSLQTYRQLCRQVTHLQFCRGGNTHTLPLKPQKHMSNMTHISTINVYTTTGNARYVTQRPPFCTRLLSHSTKPIHLDCLLSARTPSAKGATMQYPITSAAAMCAKGAKVSLAGRVCRRQCVTQLAGITCR